LKVDPLDIATRHGLPDELLVLARLYPRDGWRGHENFSDLTAFWLERHMMFREVLSRIESATEMHITRPQPRFGPEIARYTGFLLNQLHGHHGIEDQHYFPRLKLFDARLERAFVMLDADHHALDRQIHGLAEATNHVLTRLNAGQSAEAGPLYDTQQSFAGFLDRHLSDEEEIVVPVLLEYGADFS
jgi:iron-sulfur cluster repair protein YtfE (RIC family)